MKKVLIGFILGAITATSVTVIATTQDMFTAQKATFEIEVDGEKFEGENPPLVVGGRTYLALRDTGEALGVPVEWNETERKVEIGGNVEPTAEPKTEPTATPVPESTAEPTQTNIPNPTPEVIEKMKSLGLFKIKSDVVYVNDIVTYSIYEYKGEYYIGRDVFKGFYRDDELYSQLYDKEGNEIGEPILIARTNWFNPETAHKDLRVDSMLQIKLSAFNLKARLDHETGTCWIEWIEEP